MALCPRVVSDPLRVAYLGLGAMGARMASTLLRRGFPLHVWNRTPAKAAPLHAAGARILDTLADLRNTPVDVVCTNVSDDAALQELALGPSGLRSILPSGCVVLDHSSVLPATAIEVASELARHNIGFIDAPVSGGVHGAETGTLTIMAGGDERTLARIRPVLVAMSSTVHHIGPVGAGQAAKLCNQVAVACVMLGVCESLGLAAKFGLRLPQMIELFGGGAAASAALKLHGPKLASGDLKAGFRVDLMVKDLESAHQLARRIQLPLFAAPVASALLHSLQASGDGGLGWQALSRVYERMGNFSYTQTES